MKSKELKYALILSEQMLQAAEEKRWQDFSDLMQQRREMLQNSSAVESDSNLVLMLRGLNTLQTIDHKIKLICSNRKAELVSNLQGTNKASKASSAYKKCSA